MQVAALDDLRARIHRAFDSVEMPSRIEQMRLAKYDGDDSYEMAAAFVGKRWADVPIKELFYHRESLATSSAVAFRALLPAYLIASLASDDPFDRYGADLRGYLVSSLAVFPHHSDPDRPTETRERLSLLDAEQRAAVADALRYFELRWHMTDASDVLHQWP